MRLGAYETELPKALSEYVHPDCLVLAPPPDRLLSLFALCIDYLSSATLLLIRGIHASPAARQAWRTICSHPTATVCIDAYTWGITFVRPGLPHQRFKSIV